MLIGSNLFLFFSAAVSYGEHLHLPDGAIKMYIFFFGGGEGMNRNHFATSSGQNLTISGLCMEVNITEYHLAQSHHFFYKSPFHDIYFLKKKNYRLEVLA